MNCPKCGKEMEEGYLHGGAWRLWWDKKPERFTWVRRRGTETLAYGYMMAPTVKAYKCEQCRLVLANY